MACHDLLLLICFIDGFAFFGSSQRQDPMRKGIADQSLGNQPCHSFFVTTIIAGIMVGIMFGKDAASARLTTKPRHGEADKLRLQGRFRLFQQ
jgi:hypothetical protein